ncbi:MAG: hypothetical protein KBG15_16335 [Kofleriaceae bacterium]|nr:hypothetical protein [Kofleriaceae bacterium]
MIESFVDLTYRGIELARRVKLTAVSASHGYLEVATPMPVGTEVAITTDENVRFTALVSEIHEQIAGATQAPGMRVAPSLLEADAQSWWAARSASGGPSAATAPVIVAPALAAPVITSPASIVNMQAAAPAPRHSAAILAQVEAESMTATHDVVDDGRRTVAMDAVDPALLEQLLNGTPTAQTDGEPEADSGPGANAGAAKKKNKRNKGR